MGDSIECEIRAVVALLLLAACAMGADSGAQAATTTIEDELMEFYQATDGPSWLRQQGWYSAAQERGIVKGTLTADPSPSDRPQNIQSPRWCHWEGVECERLNTFGDDGEASTRFVMVGLTLPKNGLSGRLPLRLLCVSTPATASQQHAFTHIRLLNVSRNRLEGDGLVFHSSDANCPRNSRILENLVTVDVSFNHLNASLNSLLLRSFPRLRFASARGNLLTGPIFSTTDHTLTQTTASTSVRFPCLEVFDVGHNRLLGQFPSASFAFHTPHLRVLRLDNNYFVDQTFSWLVVPAAHGVGSGLGWHFSLSVLHVHNNYVQAPIPPTVSQFVNLRELVADGNRIYGTVPRELRNLRLLSTLSLAHNFLRGTIPCGVDHWFAEHTPFLELRVVDLTDNDLDGPVCAVHRDHSIEVLRLADNSFTGAIPSMLGAKLKEVTLGGENQWACELPPASAVPAWMDPAPSTRCVMDATSGGRGGDVGTDSSRQKGWFGDDLLLFPRRRGGSRGSMSFGQDLYRRNATALTGARLSPLGAHVFTALLTLFLLVPLSAAVATAAGIELPARSLVHMLFPERFLNWIHYEYRGSED